MTDVIGSVKHLLHLLGHDLVDKMLMAQRWCPLGFPKPFKWLIGSSSSRCQDVLNDLKIMVLRSTMVYSSSLNPLLRLKWEPTNMDTNIHPRLHRSPQISCRIANVISYISYKLAQSIPSHYSIFCVLDHLRPWQTTFRDIKITTSLQGNVLANVHIGSAFYTSKQTPMISCKPAAFTKV